MGMFDEFEALIPEDKRGDFRAKVSQLDGAVKIDSRETAERLANENPHFKSAIDAAISKAVASHDAKFLAEKLPTIVEEEIKKRGPKPKDPELAAALERVEALERAKSEAERERNQAWQRAKVLPKLTEWGMDAELADRLIGNSDAETEALLGAFEKSFVKARNGYHEKMMREKFGNQAVPPMGNKPPNTREALTARYAELMNARQFQQALVVQAELQKLGE